MSKIQRNYRLIQAHIVMFGAYLLFNKHKVFGAEQKKKIMSHLSIIGTGF